MGSSRPWCWYVRVAINHLRKQLVHFLTMIFSLNLSGFKYISSLPTIIWLSRELTMYSVKTASEFPYLWLVCTTPCGISSMKLRGSSVVLASLSGEIIDDSSQIADPTVAPWLFQIFLALIVSMQCRMNLPSFPVVIVKRAFFSGCTSDPYLFVKEL